MGFVDGSLKAPPKFVPSSTTEGTDLMPNSAYDQWVDQDQHVLSGLLSSMTEDVLPDVVSASTAQDAWHILTGMFSSATRARIVQIRIELTTTKKRDLSVADYFHQIKGFTSELAAADAPLRDEDVIAYLLAGLGPDYDSFITSMTTKTGALTLDNVYNYFMSYEARQLQHQAATRLHVGTSVTLLGVVVDTEMYPEDAVVLAAALLTLVALVMVILGSRLAEVVVVLRLTATTTTNVHSVRSVAKWGIQRSSAGTAMMILTKRILHRLLW
jgi:hypothetical protein